MPTTRGRPVAGRRGLRPRRGHLRRRVFQRWRSVDHRRSGVYTAVAATASGSNREYVNSLGADEFVDYREQRFETSVAPVHAVIDTVGGTVQQRSLDVLSQTGFSSLCQRRSRTRSRPKPSDAVYGCDTSASNRTLTR
ncbi:zinc-binding dehydrogenase [Rhodococcus sp. 21391]|uniref:zinc-binding dehydrogenase n=1 Tax=Rhodococcus sp. 21391 TaxID=2683591 RepID=UPI0024B5E366|nr:zinc-binding dehydrogenase [Rhodococcus sp. 21391]